MNDNSNDIHVFHYYYYIPRYLKTSDFAAVRGPIASNVVYQMITQTLWGDLDFLIIDMPPGTGDIHLTIAQSVPITAAVMVTTPQQLR